MARTEWIAAAQNFSRLNERERADYWNQLAPIQRQELQEALQSIDQGPRAAEVDAVAKPTKQRGGCGSPLAIGCMGVALGVVSDDRS